MNHDTETPFTFEITVERLAISNVDIHGRFYGSTYVVTDEAGETHTIESMTFDGFLTELDAWLTSGDAYRVDVTEVGNRHHIIDIAYL